jgi:hypothetical protein
VACGGSGEACCAGDTCSASGTACNGGTCVVCGGNGQACCGGDTCSSGYACSASPTDAGPRGVQTRACRACGSRGQPCCGTGANRICSSGLACSTPDAGGFGQMETCQ